MIPKFLKETWSLYLMTEIPIPDSSGNTGQEEPRQELLPPKPEPGLPLVDTIERGLATSPIAVGDFASTMVSSVLRLYSNEAEELRNEKEQLSEKLDSLNIELGNARQENAVLAERLASDRGIRHLRNVGVAVGTSMACTFAFSDFLEGPVQFALVLLGLGLVLASWVVPNRNSKKPKKDN